MSYEKVNPLGPSMQLLQGQQLEKELDIVPEQREAIAQLRKEMAEKTRGLWTSTEGADPQERTKRYQEAAKALAAETEKRLQEIILPHQKRRLDQIALQSKLRLGYGSARALTADDVAGELGISDEQKELLRQTEQELAKEIREKTQEFQKKLQAETREKLLSVLSRSQRRKLERMLGEPFERPPPQPYTQPLKLPAGGAFGPEAGGVVLPPGEIERIREQVELFKGQLP
jgi:hypothetical protein